MAASVGNDDVPSRDPHLPPMHRIGDVAAPKPPQDIASAGLDEGTLTGLILRLGYTVMRFSTDSLGKQLHLSMALTNELLEKLCFEGLVEQVWQTTQASAHYKITDHGRDHAARSMETCGYVGPAPVRMETYAAMLRWQFAN